MGPATADLDTLLNGGTGKRHAYVETARKGGAQSTRMPLAVVQGARSGPTVWISASLHGDEYLGPAASAALLRRLDPDTVRGRILLSPTLNTAAVRAMQRTDPTGSEDWNRLWSAVARASARDPAIGWAESVLLPRCDAVIDLHSGGNHFLQAPFAVFSKVGGKVDRRSSEFAKSCGLPLIWAHRDSFLEGALITEAARQGKPAVLIEMEGEGKAEPAWVDRMVAAVEGALAHAGVLSGSIQFCSSYRVFEGLTVIRNREEGLWSRTVEPAGAVRDGESLGVVSDPLGQELERVASPMDGIVVGICTYGFVPRDDYIAELGTGFHSESPPG